MAFSVGAIVFIAIVAVANSQTILKAATFSPAPITYTPRPFTYTPRPVTYSPIRVKYDNRDKNDGRYYSDDSGAYHPDDSGAYVHSDVPYQHQAGNDGGAGPGYKGYQERYPENRGDVRPTTAPVTSGLKTGNAAGLYDNRNYAIIRKVEDVGLDGYHYLYETENGIFGEEQGHLEQVGSEKEAMRAKGYFKYTGPDNVIYEVEYTADEDGFKPVGAHLPQPPAIPEAIVRSLEYQRSLGILQ